MSQKRFQFQCFDDQVTTLTFFGTNCIFNLIDDRIYKQGLLKTLCRLKLQDTCVFGSPCILILLHIIRVIFIKFCQVIINPLIFRHQEESGDVPDVMEKHPKRSSRDRVRYSTVLRRRRLLQLTQVLTNLILLSRRRKLLLRIIPVPRIVLRRREVELPRLTRISPSVRHCCLSSVDMKTPGLSLPQSTPSSFLLTRKSSKFPWTYQPSERN